MSWTATADPPIRFQTIYFPLSTTFGFILSAHTHALDYSTCVPSPHHSCSEAQRPAKRNNRRRQTTATTTTTTPNPRARSPFFSPVHHPPAALLLSSPQIDRVCVCKTTEIARDHHHHMSTTVTQRAALLVSPPALKSRRRRGGASIRLSSFSPHTSIYVPTSSNRSLAFSPPSWRPCAPWASGASWAPRAQRRRLPPNRHHQRPPPPHGRAPPWRPWRASARSRGTRPWTRA